ncbi:MAG TPA: histidinol-phosphate transaminase [Polyangiaceae bacterium]|nr:histidinol-phosphate transaminase [Polyangiaceae bacterium]
MTQARVTRAVVLAAGTGSRLADGQVLPPKPLRPVAQVPLLVRVLLALESVGVQEAVIITGFQGELVRKSLLADPRLGLKLIFVDNREYEKKNGVSLLAARDYIDRECLLTMADHLYSPELVRRLLAAEIPAGACALAVDRDIEGCFDLDDATKVRVERGQIAAISKELERYDAIDTGVFRIGPALIDELSGLYNQSGDCSLSDGVRALAGRGRFLAVDVGDVRWIDVDTPVALERAEAMLRVFGDHLGDEPGSVPPRAIDPDAIELFAPSWVRAARPYSETHFDIADKNANFARMMSNESPYAPSQRVVSAILEAALRGNLYPGGARELCTKLGQRDGLDGDSVLLGAGSTELIDVIIRTFVGPGEEAVISVPTFSMYEARTRVVGGIPVLVPMTEEHEHDVVGMIRAVTERTKLLFVCVPNNPTGASIALDDLRRLLRLGLPTVIDEAYQEFTEADSFVELCSEFPNAMVLRTFSKAYGLAGLRLGYALAHPAVITLLSRVKVPWNIPSVTIAAASAALDDFAEFDRRRLELKEARAELAARVDALGKLTIVPGEGNFLLIDVSGTSYSAEQLVEALLAEGVLIRSLGVHHATRSYVRITVGTREQNLRCVGALERVLARKRGRVFASSASSDAE